MADSLKKRVLIALTNHLKGITPANSYSRDLSNAVFRGRSRYGDSDPEEMISILEAPRPDAALFGGDNKRARREEWLLLVQGWTKDDPENPADPVYDMAADVEHRLQRCTEEGSNGVPKYPNEFMLGMDTTGIAEMTFTSAIVRPPTDQVSNKAFFYLPLRIVLVPDVA